MTIQSVAIDFIRRHGSAINSRGKRRKMVECQNEPEYQALLIGILERPQDDARRLILSDWLEEHGQDERAELIRLQIGGVKSDRVELLIRRLRGQWGIFPRNSQQIDLGPSDTIQFAPIEAPDGQIVTRITCRDSLKHRTYPGMPVDLVLHYGEVMSGLICPDDVRSDNSWSFSVSLDPEIDRNQAWSRGFVSSITLDCDQFMRNAEELFRRHPITDVVLNDKAPYKNSWFACEVSNGSLNLSDECKIPTDLFNVLVDFERHRGRVFTSRDEALKNLSIVCVAYGRRLAALPRLVPDRNFVPAL